MQREADLQTERRRGPMKVSGRTEEEKEKLLHLAAVITKPTVR
jgi:hypothetical protein